MGEVYRARDPRLGREIAIKVLPEHLAESPERKQRLEREAKAISQLNHPHICTLHEFDTQDGIDFLVMEYLEGETLADRLKKGALALDKAYEYGIQIADGLARAHETGIVHRDLKPGNVFLTKAGVKLLDFGLAKLEARGSSDLSSLPTEQKPLTEEGAVLGTFQYMAPEQLEAKEADARTDIFALGAVLYEMVTGRKAFEGKSQASLITAIMSSEPPALSAHQPLAPLALDRIVETCLAKDPDDRWQHVSDVKRQLEWLLERNGLADLHPAGPYSTRRLAPWGIAALMSAVAALSLWSQLRRTGPATDFVTRLVVTLPEDRRLTGAAQSFAVPIALSPDGRRLVYSAVRDQRPQLYIRDMDRFDEEPIPGTEGATSPFFSPDGAWVGFFANGRLQKVPLAGGAPVNICEIPAYRGTGIDWGANDKIVFTSSALGSGLFHVPAAGGRPERLTTPDPERGEYGHAWPQFLPDGQSILFALWGGESWGAAILSLETRKWQTILPGVARVRFLPTGHLIYGVYGSSGLQAVPFDLARLGVDGSPIPVLDGVDFIPRSGRASYAVSRTGSLVYVPARPVERSLVWVDRQGKASPITEERGSYEFPRLSPDGRRVALQLGGDTWIHDLERGTRTRHTVEGGNLVPVWTPDGSRVAFASIRGGPWNLYWKPADGGGEAELLLPSKRCQFPMSWSPDGQVLAFQEYTSETAEDIWMLDQDGEAQPFVVTRFREQTPRFSRDGRFVAYVSNESGRHEVYVQPYPATGKRWTVSTNGGTEPLWSPDGRTLFYRQGDRVMAVALETSAEFLAGKPRQLFEEPFEADIYPNYDISPDGNRFVMVRRDSSPPREIHVVLNWFEELKRLVPTD
jgi:serine/threonine-protein kinase